MSRASANSAAANDWARKKKEAMERAARLKAHRKAGGLDGEGDGLEPPGTGSYSRPISSRATAIHEPSPSYDLNYGGGYANAHYGPPAGYHQGGTHQGHSEHSPTSSPSYGRRSTSREEAEHMLDQMPALDLKPVRVRRPPSSSRMHSQGQPKEALDMGSDWSSPVQLQYSARANNQMHGYTSFLEESPQSIKRQYSSAYQQGALDDWQQPAQERRTKGPSPGRRSRRPEWNADFAETAALDLNDGPPHKLETAPHAPRSGRRATPPSNTGRPDWNGDFVESNAHQEDAQEATSSVPAGRAPRIPSAAGRPPPKAAGRPRQQEWNAAGPDHAEDDSESYLVAVEHRAASRPGSSARGMGLAKLKKMSLRRAGSRGSSGSSPTPGQRPVGAAGICGGANAELPGRTILRQEHEYQRGPSPAPAPYPQDYRSPEEIHPEQPPEYLDTQVKLLECSGCGRKFNEKALARHASICAKVFQQKRKPMNMTKQRVGGTEAAKHFRGSPGDTVKPSPIKQAALERRQGGGRGSQSSAPSGSRQSAQQSYVPSDYQDPDPWVHERQEGAPSRRQHQPSARKPSARAAPCQQRPLLTSPESHHTSGSHSHPFGQGVDPAAGGGSAPGVDVPEYAPQGQMTQCRGCGRKFNERAYATHAKICAKVFQGKRKPVDMTAQRVAGTEAAKFVGKAKGAERMGSRQSARAVGRPGGRRPEDQVISTKATNQPKWKQQSQGLRAAMAANRQIKEVLDKGGDIRDIPMAQSAPDPSLVQCPHCGRRFNEAAAERHIPKCKDIIAKPKFLSRNAGKGAYARKPSAGNRR